MHLEEREVAAAEQRAAAAEAMAAEREEQEEEAVVMAASREEQEATEQRAAAAAEALAADGAELSTEGVGWLELTPTKSNASISERRPLSLMSPQQRAAKANAGAENDDPRAKPKPSQHADENASVRCNGEMPQQVQRVATRVVGLGQDGVSPLPRRVPLQALPR
jgi:hypothetical protein